MTAQVRRASTGGTLCGTREGSNEGGAYRRGGGHVQDAVRSCTLDAPREQGPLSSQVLPTAQCAQEFI